MKDRNADILVSKQRDTERERKLVGRGSLGRAARDPAEEPIGFLVFTLEARVPTLSTNHRRRICTR